MNKAKLLRNMSKFGMKMKHHSPTILMVAGVVGVVGSTVMACKATRKLDDILDNAKKDIETIKKAGEHPETLPEEYTEEECQQDLTITYARTGMAIAKLYGPSIALGALSLGSIIFSHRILNKRNVALASAYAAVHKGFKDYRGRVVDRFGQQLDKELLYNIKPKETEEVVVNEDGSEEIVKKTANVIDPNTISEFAKIWADGDKGWTKDPHANLAYVRQQMNYANEILKRRGYLFLNEVYDMFGFDHSEAGQVIGWVYNEKLPVGDNFVDFGIYDPKDQARINFVNGNETNVLLDFNVDGYIAHLI